MRRNWIEDREHCQLRSGKRDWTLVGRYALAWLAVVCLAVMMVAMVAALCVLLWREVQ